MNEKQSKATPGPWSVGGQNGHGGLSIDTEQGDMIATVYLNTVSSEWRWGEGHTRQPVNAESVANAALIAAAPDLLEALRTAVHLVETDVIRVRASEREQLIAALTSWNAAITKATQGD